MLFAEQINDNIDSDGMGGYIIKLKAGLPRCKVKNQVSIIKDLFCRLLDKAEEGDLNSVAFSIEEIQNWDFVSFLECLLLTSSNRFKESGLNKPVFVELCNSNENEYKMALFHCHRFFSTFTGKVGKLINKRTLSSRLEMSCNSAERMVPFHGISKKKKKSNISIL